MPIAPCPRCNRNVNSQHIRCPYCGQTTAPKTAVAADKFLGAAQVFGGLVYFTGLIWMAVDPSRPLAAVVAAVVGGAAFFAGRLFRGREGR